jgi:hypothetical protein
MADGSCMSQIELERNNRQSDGRTKPMTMVVPRMLCMVYVLILLLVLPSAGASAPAEETGSCADESCGANYTLPPIENDGSIGFAFGKRQVVGLTPSKETLDLMRSMNNYMQDQDQKRCTLNFEQCVYWASIGKCRSNRTKDRPIGSRPDLTKIVSTFVHRRSESPLHAERMCSSMLYLRLGLDDIRRTLPASQSHAPDQRVAEWRSESIF